jgi:peptidoglycan hydrolase-like protein with peptidoglycan-binding domain
VKRFRATLPAGLVERRECEHSAPYSGLEIEEGKVVGPELWPFLIEPLEYQSKRGFAVKALQTALVELHGCADIRVDGYFGYLTLQAVQSFQSDYAANRIDVDGVAGPLTWLHLLGSQTEPDDLRGAN